ncbi:MAG: hypothetical protein OIF51_21315, partial [Cellvibrionaceae bacterium]|nr:hypothetical protein [Cellvibrionaceae bacterium]
MANRLDPNLKPYHLKPWHLILFGIALSISAALMQHIRIEEKFADLEELDTKVANLDARIDSLWQQHVEAERKKEFASLLLALHKKTIIQEDDKLPRTAISNMALNEVLTKYLASIQNNTFDNNRISDNSVQKVETSPGTQIEAHQRQLRNQIDDLYFESLELRKLRRPLQKEIDVTRNIALLLQLLGLILVL